MKDIKELIPDVEENKEFVVPEYVHIRDIDIKKHFNLASLADLKTDHMNAAQKAEFRDLFSKLREWKELCKTKIDASFILLGNPGIGKTHIAQAAHDAKAEAHWSTDMIDINDPEALVLVKHARFYTAEEIMRLMEDDKFKISDHTKLIVVDEIGRENTIKFEKRDDEYQEAAKMSHYFRLTKMCVNRCSLFITSNATSAQFKQFFDDATYSRLLGMCAEGHIYEMKESEDYRPFLSGRKKQEI